METSIWRSDWLHLASMHFLSDLAMLSMSGVAWCCSRSEAVWMQRGEEVHQQQCWEQMDALCSGCFAVHSEGVWCWMRERSPTVSLGCCISFSPSLHPPCYSLLQTGPLASSLFFPCSLLPAIFSSIFFPSAFFRPYRIWVRKKWDRFLKIF